MKTDYLEHANLTVSDIDKSVKMIRTALPSWQVRGQGESAWFGKTIRWLHLGTESSYLALQEGGEGKGLDWFGHAVGMKHLGFVVYDLATVITRLEQAGFLVEHLGGVHPYRKSAYFVDADNNQFEFIQYLSDQASQRNDYLL